MVLSYLRMACPLDEAMACYGRWIAAPAIEPPRLIRERDKIDAALKDGEWRGLAVFIYASGPWTVFEELSSGLSDRSTDSWLELARDNDLVYAGYNDTIPYAELLVVEKGRVVRRFLHDEQDSGADQDIGQLPEEAEHPFAECFDVMAWIDQDDERLAPRPEQGWLWIHLVS